MDLLGHFEAWSFQASTSTTECFLQHNAARVCAAVILRGRLGVC